MLKKKCGVEGGAILLNMFDKTEKRLQYRKSKKLAANRTGRKINGILKVFNGRIPVF